MGKNTFTMGKNTFTIGKKTFSVDKNFEVISLNKGKN